MYKSLAEGIKKVKLDSELYKLHKSGDGSSDFGMDNTSALLEQGFGLYSTKDLKKNIGPIKTQYYRISLTRGGSAMFEVGLEKYHTKRNSILFGIPDQIFSLSQFSHDFLAYYLLFTEHFIADVMLKINRKQEFPFLSFSGNQCFQLDEETAQELENIIFHIHQEIKVRKQGTSDMIRLYIHQIILLSSRNYGNELLSHPPALHAHQNLYSQFLKSVGQYYTTVRKVSEYAAMLHISPDHLNRAIKSCSDKTAHEHIDEMLMMEAKALLLHTRLSIAEISYQLEFSSPSHFNRFFKKYSELTPVEFRNQSE